MDKKKQMPFNLNNFLLATAIALDYKINNEQNISLNHHKRVCYIALNLGIKFNLESNIMADLCSYSLAYSLGKSNLKKLPFTTGKEILNNDLINQIIDFSVSLDKNFLQDLNINKNEVISNVERNEDKYSKELVEKFLDISFQISFWEDLKYENEILMFIYANLHDFTIVLDFEEILKITTIFHKLENQNSLFLERAEKITDEFEFEHKDKQIFLIASSLQNIGKLFISSSILNKKEVISQEEYEVIKTYPYHTKRVISSIMGFADVLSLAIKVQERVNGSGYLYGLDGKSLSFKDRLLGCLLIYNALREERSYRESYPHDKAINIMKEEAKREKVDISLVEHFDRIFA